MKRHTLSSYVPVWLVTALALTSAACSGNAAPTPVLTTETLTGTLQVLGSDSRNFTVTYNGGSSDGAVTVVSLNTVADSTAVSTTIGVAFGSIQFDGSCLRSASYTAPAAAIGQELVASSAFSASTYCVQIFDFGTLTEPVKYSMTLKHF